MTRSDLSEQDGCRCSREASWEAAGGGQSQEGGMEG